MVIIQITIITRDFVRLLITANRLHNNIYHTYRLYFAGPIDAACIHGSLTISQVYIYCCVEFQLQLLQFELAGYSLYTGIFIFYILCVMFMIFRIVFL